MSRFGGRLRCFAAFCLTLAAYVTRLDCMRAHLSWSTAITLEFRGSGCVWFRSVALSGAVTRVLALSTRCTCRLTRAVCSHFRLSFLDSQAQQLQRDGSTLNAQPPTGARLKQVGCAKVGRKACWRHLLECHLSTSSQWLVRCPSQRAFDIARYWYRFVFRLGFGFGFGFARLSAMKLETSQSRN